MTVRISVYLTDCLIDMTILVWQVYLSVSYESKYYAFLSCNSIFSNALCPHSYERPWSRSEELSAAFYASYFRASWCPYMVVRAKVISITIAHAILPLTVRNWSTPTWKYSEGSGSALPHSFSLHCSLLVSQGLRPQHNLISNWRSHNLRDC